MADRPIRVKAYGRIVNFPAGTAPEAIESALAEHEPTLNPDYKAPEPEALDYAKGFAVGANKLGSGAGFLMESAGAKETGKSVREFFDRGAQYWNDKMSKGGQLAAKSQVFIDDDNEDSVTGIKLSDDWGKALLMGASQSLPSMFAAALPGVAITKGIQALASLGLAGGAGATIPLLAGIAAPVGVASHIIARAPSALGFGLAEGGVAGATNAAEFKTSIESMTDKELNKSPVYRALKEEHGPDNAKSLLAEQAALDLFGKTALSTGAIGALTGGGALGQAYRKATSGARTGLLGTVAKGSGAEALQEAPQSGGEQYIQNLTTQSYLDPTKSASEGVLTAAASGAAIGGLMGGVVGAGGAINITPDRRAQVLNEKRKIAEAKARAANTRQQEQGMADIGSAQDIDQVIMAANKATRPSVTANDVLRTEDPTLADIERLTGLKPTEAIDTAIDEINNLQPQEEIRNDSTQTQQKTATQTPVLENDVKISAGTAQVEGSGRGSATIGTVENPVPPIEGTSSKVQPLAKDSPVLNAETFKATGNKISYNQYLREHPNRKQAAAIDSRSVENNLVKGLQKTGKFNVADSKTYARPFSEFYRVNAERQGILPSELYERMPLKFSGKKAQTLGQDAKATPASRNKVNFDQKDATPEDFTPENVGSLLNRKNWAVITAANPAGKAQSDTLNIKANQALQKELADKGLAFEVVQGRYPGDKSEMESYLVYGIDRKVANELGNKYGQDSVLTREGLIHQSGKVTPVISAGKGAPDGYTRIPRTGARFAFDLDWDREGSVGEGALSLVSRHYSKERRKALEGSRFGQGLPGRERDRVAESDDPRIKSRVDFYADIGEGIIPESGLGNVIHEKLLHNIYDASTNPRRFKFPQDWLGGNVFEKQVLDAGYDGYFVKQGKQGRVVILGDAAKSIPIGDTDDQGRTGELLSQPAGENKISRESDGSLQGLPRQIGEFNASLHRKAEKVAKDYMKSAGLTYNPPNTYATVNVPRAERIAQAFEEMKHNPQNPEVKAAYDALVEETAAQYKAVINSGLKVEFIDFDKTGDPYAGNPRAMTEDVRKNNHMWVFSTRDGFGSSDFDPADNPLLSETEFEISGQKALANDLFRVVHDYFGHVKEGVGFRAGGEENAWRAHMAMFSPLAGRALTTETRGQNSWVNYGPFAEFNRTASGADTKYADQKIGLLPEWVSTEGAGDETKEYSQSFNLQSEAFRKWFGNSKVVDKGGRPLVVYHGTKKSFDNFEIGAEGKSSTIFGSYSTKRAGIFFSEDPREASGFANQGEEKEGANILPVRLSIKNPADLRRGFQHDRKLYEALIEAGVSERYMINSYPDTIWEAFDEEQGGFDFVAALKQAGYDGALIAESNPDTNKNFDVWVAFDPSQIKSAVGNNGEFNPSDPSILKQSNFYSALEREVPNLKKIANKDGLVSVEQAKAWINSRQKEGKFKQAEVEAVGLLDWFDTLEGKVPVIDVEQFVANNGVQVEEVILEGEGSAPEIDEDRAYDDAFNDFAENYIPEYPDEVFDNAIADVAGEMLQVRNDKRWSDLVGLNDANEVQQWLDDEDVESTRDMVRVLKNRYDTQEIIGEDKYYEIVDAEQQDAWERNQDYYLDQVRERLRDEAGVNIGGVEFGDYVLRGGGTEYKELLLTLPNSKDRFSAPHFDQAQENGAENIFAHTRINERYVDVPLTDEELSQKAAYDEWVKGNHAPEIMGLMDAKREAARDYSVALGEWKEKAIKDTSISNKQYEEAINTLGSNPPEELKPFIKRIEEIGAKVKAKQEERLAVKPPEPTRSQEKERVLFIEEIQSDWAQKGRDEGFSGLDTAEQREFDELNTELYALNSKELTPAEQSRKQDVFSRIRELRDKRSRGVPAAPFVTDTKAWTGLVVKRLLRYAAENGFDRIAWTTGAQQSERYRLSKSVELIEATRSETLPDSYMIKAVTPEGKSVLTEYYEASKLAGVIGKELAEKIIAQPDGKQTYSGLDLDVGGQGMKEFYDRIVPSVVNDISRKLGGDKVENISMGSQSGKIITGLDGKILIAYPNGSYLKNRNTGVMTESQDRADSFDSREEANKYLDKFESQNLHDVGRQMSLAITPALKEKVMQGLPLFQQDRAGYNPNTFTISLMDGSDMSSVIHEGGHFYLEALADMASRPDAPEQIVKDFDTTLKWFGLGLPASKAASTKRSKGYPTPAGEPISTFDSADKIKAHPSYAEAKAGGDQAAYDLVQDLVTKENLEEAKQRFSGATFVPVSLIDKDGANRIPTAMAYHYANAVGGSVSDQIFETEKAYHTGMTAMERLVSRAGFSGKVEPGRKYVLVDDVTTIGSTLADLASYVQENGGEVVGSVLLANATRSGKMFANAKTLKRLEVQYGNEIKELFNIEPSALTQEESQYLIGFRDADELRNSAVKAQSSRLSRIHARQVPESESSVEAQKRRNLWGSMTLEQKRPYHEQWAQSFELYALEGVSPTEEMQPVFERFKQWMLETYKSLKEFLKNNPLAGRLNNDVRQVFDRLLASDADIAAVAAKRNTLKQSRNNTPIKIYDKSLPQFAASVAKRFNAKPIGKSESSRYYKLPNGKELRVSDHEFPREHGGGVAQVDIVYTKDDYTVDVFENEIKTGIKTDELSYRSLNLNGSNTGGLEGFNGNVDNWESTVTDTINDAVHGTTRGTLGQSNRHGGLYDLAIESAIKTANIEQESDNKSRIEEELDSIYVSGNGVDIKRLMSDSALWNTEDEELTEEGQKEYDRLNEALARERAGVKGVTELNDVNNLSQTVQAEVFNSYANALGLNTNLLYSAGGSRYVEVQIGDAAYKFRFADHFNTVRDSTLIPDFNVAPGRSDFTEAIDFLKDKFESAESFKQSSKQTTPKTNNTPVTKNPVGSKRPFNPNEDIPETKFRKVQRLTQDSFNRFTVIKDWLKNHGVTLSEKADVFQAEERYNSLVANQLEDFRERVRNPLIEKIAKAKFTLDDIADFLEAQHAEEANKANQDLRSDPTATAYGITDVEAKAYLAKADPVLAKLANELRDITEQSKQIRLQAGLLDRDTVDAWDNAYKFYIPVKGDADAKGGTGKGLKVNFKSKRRLGHGRRNEAVIENIFLDHERAIMQVEKNRVAKHLVMMAAEMNMPEIVSVGQPVKRNVLRNKTAYEVQVNGVTRSIFNNKQAANMFKQLLPTIDESVQAGTITVNTTSDQRVIAMASPMLAENEIYAYIEGHAIRVQINDDLLARAYSKLGITGFSALVSAGRTFNGYLSKVYTGYNPEFIITNMIRDFSSGLINLTGEEGGKIALKASANYIKSFVSLLRYATSNGKKSNKWIDMYRANGGNTGAAYLSDMERLGEEVKTEYAAYQGLLANLKSGDITNASRAAGRKAFNVTLKWIYNLNQAGENAMRLAAFRAMIESGKTKNEAAKVAKNITVNFNRKGERGAEANAAYLFFNASVQGTAALAHAHFKGKHKFQAWGLSSMVGVLGYLAAMALIGDDEDDYDKINDYTKSRNFMIKAGDGYAQIPVPYGYGFFWNTGRAIAEAQHKGELGKLPWHMAASAIEELTPFSDTVVGSQDGFQFDQVLLGMLPTAIKIPAQPALNKQLFSGGEMFPERASQQFQPDREKLWRSTQGTMYDKMAGWLSDAGLGDVSPETLKHYTRTATGGTGALVDATVSAAMLKKEGAELEPSEIPFVRKAYSKLTIKDQRAAYNTAREEAKKTAEAFSRAKTKNDVTTIDKLVKDEGEMIGLDAYANSLSEAIGAVRDLQDAIRLDDSLGAAEKRLKIKELEITEGKFYDQYLDVFKVEKLKMKERKN